MCQVVSCVNNEGKSKNERMKYILRIKDIGFYLFIFSIVRIKDQERESHPHYNNNASYRNKSNRNNSHVVESVTVSGEVNFKRTR